MGIALCLFTLLVLNFDKIFMCFQYFKMMKETVEVSEEKPPLVSKATGYDNELEEYCTEDAIMTLKFYRGDKI